MLGTFKLAELLCTRLCHDLTGPIGAVNNGAEFLSEEGFNLQSQAVELITSSAFSAVSRLQFYRMAYGHVKDSGEASLSDNRKLAADFFVGSKISLDWPEQYADAGRGSVSMRMMRLLFNLLIIGSSVLLKGGTLSVKIEQGEKGSKIVEIIAHGDTVKWESETEMMLTRSVDPLQITPKNVQLYLTRKLADELHAELAFAVTANEWRATAVQKAQGDTM